MTGTPSFEAICGTKAAVEYLAVLGDGADRRAALAAGYAKIRERETALADQFLSGVAHLSEWKVWGITDAARLHQRVPTFGLTHRTLTPSVLAATLGDQGIFTWNGNFYAPGLIEALGLSPEGMLRIGFLHYNTTEEVSGLLNSLAQFG